MNDQHITDRTLAARATRSRRQRSAARQRASRPPLKQRPACGAADARRPWRARRSRSFAGAVVAPYRAVVYSRGGYRGWHDRDWREHRQHRRHLHNDD
jgi:hypothetical protein